MIQVNNKWQRQQVWQLCLCMNVCLWLSLGLEWVVQPACNWLVFPPQWALTSINRTAEEPGWNLMPLFSLSDPTILSLLLTYAPSFFLHSKRKTISHLLRPPPPATLLRFLPRLVFQPVSLFNRLISPSLIKHAHEPCVCALHRRAFRLHIPLFLCSSSPTVYWHFISHPKVYCLSFCFCLSSLFLSPFSLPQVVSFNSSKLFIVISTQDTKANG